MAHGIRTLRKCVGRALAAFSRSEVDDVAEVVAIGVLVVLLVVLATIIAAGGAVVGVAALIGGAFVLGVLLIVVGLGLV